MIILMLHGIVLDGVLDVHVPPFPRSSDIATLMALSSNRPGFDYRHDQKEKKVMSPSDWIE